MNKQPDKFFRDKLQDYQPAVSPEVWKRVAGNLGEKSNRSVWLKIAAGLLLMAAAGILIFPIKKDLRSTFVSEKTGASQKEESAAKEKIIPGERQPVDNEQIETTPPPIADRKTKDVKKDTKNVGEHNEVATTQLPQVELPEIAEEKNSIVESNAVAVDQATERRNVTIVFTAQEVNEKYLKKKNTLAEATPEARETSTWRKVLDKAYDLKTNQDPIGNLRQKKNEILALNFKNNQSHENQ